MTAAEFVLVLAVLVTVIVGLQFGLRIGIAACESILSRIGRRVPKVGGTFTLSTGGYLGYKKGNTLLVFDRHEAKTHRIVSVSEDRTTITVEPIR